MGLYDICLASCQKLYIFHGNYGKIMVNFELHIIVQMCESCSSSRQKGVIGRLNGHFAQKCATTILRPEGHSMYTFESYYQLVYSQWSL